MIGLFVTALVGVYTIGEKFGDTKMPVVRPPVTVVEGEADKVIRFCSETN